MLPARGNSTNAGRVRLGELLVKAGVISDAQLKTALQEQKQWGGKLGDILVRMRYVSEDVFVRALSKQLGLPRADLNGAIPLEALAKVPAELAEEYEIVPVALLDDGKTLAIATSDPLNVTVVDYVRSVASMRVVAHVAGASAIRAAIARLYQSEDLRGEAGGGRLEILANSQDAAPGGQPSVSSPALQPVSSQPPPARSSSPGTAPSPVRSSSTSLPAQQPAPQLPLGSQPTPAFGVPSPMLAGTPAHGLQSPLIPVPSGVQQPGPMLPPMQQGPGNDRFAVLEESQRREVAALKALVELLVQKGYISLDEYLARLKR